MTPSTRPQHQQEPCLLASTCLKRRRPRHQPATTRKRSQLLSLGCSLLHHAPQPTPAQASFALSLHKLKQLLLLSSLHLKQTHPPETLPLQASSACGRASPAEISSLRPSQVLRSSRPLPTLTRRSRLLHLRRLSHQKCSCVVKVATAGSVAAPNRISMGQD